MSRQRFHVRQPDDVKQVGVTANADDQGNAESSAKMLARIYGGEWAVYPDKASTKPLSVHGDKYSQ